jgi:nitrite reductase (NO-forming)
MGIERCTRIGVLFVGALAVAACGGSDESGGEIDLIGGEQVDVDETGGFAFAGEQVTGDAPTITVQAGEEVTVNFENVGNKSPNQLVTHDFAVVPQLEDIPTLAATGALDDEVLWGASTGKVQVGETATVTFVPEEPGAYYYVCTIPGHASRGMMGEFIVTA